MIANDLIFIIFRKHARNEFVIIISFFNQQKLLNLRNVLTLGPWTSNFILILFSVNTSTVIDLITQETLANASFGGTTVEQSAIITRVIGQ